MKIESRIGLLLNALAILVVQFNPLSNYLNEFVSGLFMALGLFFIVVTILPEKVYTNLEYRKLIKKDIIK